MAHPLHDTEVDGLVSGALRGLVAGSGSRFEDRGDHEFRGIPGTWGAHSGAG